MRETHRALITEKLGRGAGSGHRVLEALYVHPIISVAQVRTITGTTYVAANQLVHRLVELGILNESTGQRRHRRFAYDAYINLFADEKQSQTETVR